MFFCSVSGVALALHRVAGFRHEANIKQNPIKLMLGTWSYFRKATPWQLKLYASSSEGGLSVL